MATEDTAAKVASVASIPHSVEAEQATIAGLLSGNRDDIDDILDIVDTDDFYREHHQVLFEAVAAMHGEGKKIDPLTLIEYLKQATLTERAGGEAYIIDLVNNNLGRSNVHEYALIVREAATHRMLIQVGNDIARLGYQPKNRSLEDLVDVAEKRVFDIAKKSVRKSTFESLKDILARTMEKIDALGDIRSEITGLPTGFPQLDKITSGLQGGDLIIVAGRPSMGKTTFAMNILENLPKLTIPARPNIVPTVAIFSMEMSGTQIVSRMISSLCQIDFNHIRSGKLQGDEYEVLNQNIKDIAELPIFIDDSSGISIYTLRRRVRRLIKEHPDLSLVAVDYLQLLKLDSGNRSRHEEVTQITRLLKEMAREFNIPVLVVSQLNRNVESDMRKDALPKLSDLRESGSIEQDADIVMFIHRNIRNPDEDNFKDKATLIIEKHRNGETGKLDLRFEGAYCRFIDPTPNP